MKMNNSLNLLLHKVKKRHSVLIAFDVLCHIATLVFYYFLARGTANGMPVEKNLQFLLNSGVQMIFIFAFRLLFGIYKNVWRYSNTKAYFDLVLADSIGSLTAVILLWTVNLFVSGIYYGLWQTATVGALTALVTLVSRFVYSLIYKTGSRSVSAKPRKPVVIAGAGRLGSYLAGDLRNNPNSEFEPLFFIDIDGTKIGNKVSGLQVYAPESAEALIKKLGIGEVIIAIVRKDSEELSKLYFHYQNLGCRVRIYDSLVADSREEKGVLRDFSIEDLLFRKPLDVSDPATVAYYENKTVLVTGGGGSIGSELCRQIANFCPKKLVIFDIYENNAYNIQQELKRHYPAELDLVVEIGSVRDRARLDELFRTHRPHVVFHAAAHKHVPLMESNGMEAIKNNCLGTCNTADAAEKYGVDKFILISTDKAVNPTNIMGASKRVCEMIVQCRRDSATTFAAVRFGNVLGSNGSVIPLFRQQIEEGGPITITDKRVIRYFMTIPEASQLVLCAGAMAKKGELFVLDMGNPVKIYDLAVNMIKLSGLKPDVDIQIKEIGLRPGEKLYEELLIKTEEMDRTDNNLIFIERDAPCSREEIRKKLAILTDALNGSISAKEAMSAIVPTYSDPETVNRDAQNSDEMRLAGCVV